MFTVKVSVRGQITVPKKLRDKLDLRPGDRVKIDIDGEEVIFRLLKLSNELY